MTKALNWIDIQRDIHRRQAQAGGPRRRFDRTAGEAKRGLYGSPDPRPPAHRGGPSRNPGFAAAFARDLPVLVVDLHGVTHIVRSLTEYEAALTSPNTKKKEIL